MENQKLDPTLKLALGVSEKIRSCTFDLNAGYEGKEKVWDLLIRYTGEVEKLQETFSDVMITPLLGQFAVVTIKQGRIEVFARSPQIVYVEKPKHLYFAMDQGRSISCINPVYQEPCSLSGKGILVACIDSGVDYTHPDFRKDDGKTRICYLWDQSVDGKPPEGYHIGTEYGEKQINEALAAGSVDEREQLVPSRDLSGHGTAVLGIAAGNGRASGGVYRGVAWESSLLVVKLAAPKADGFPRTTELIQAVDYAIRKSMELSMPLALNLSFGNSYGSHRGDSLLETYLDQASMYGRTVICVGAGNEGSQAGHVSGRVKEGVVEEVELEVGAYEAALNLQLWKRYEDELEVRLIHPDGSTVGTISAETGIWQVKKGQTRILGYYGEPSPYSTSQEVFLDFIPERGYIDSGVWKIRLIPGRIVEGEYQMWLPGGGVLNRDTHFYRPSVDMTLTIPSTAEKVITVGAYDGRLQSYADFSGRGYEKESWEIKPDLAAPGVEIVAPAPGGGYEMYTGTSFAAPFVTGSAALLMEWGIERKMDPYLYGEKVKAYLRKGARPVGGFAAYPNPQVGFGALCLKDSISHQKIAFRGRNDKVFEE